MGCSSAGVIFGGRLVFTGKTGMQVANPPSWIAGRRIVFRQERFSARPASGRGRIWIGRRGCSQEFCRQTNSNATRILPCIKHRDTTSGVNITLDLASKLTFRNDVRLIVTWNISHKLSCEIVDKVFTIKQKDLDGCETSSALVQAPRSIRIDTLNGRRLIKTKYPNSLYEVSLDVICETNDTYRKSVEIRTVEKEPTASPTNLTYELNGEMLKFEWRIPPCGKRNGNITAYDYVFQKNGQRQLSADKTRNNFKVYFDMERGDLWTFKVRAETARGRGPYTRTISYHLTN
ncbi:Neogenin [Holothuria leucospilota]|uniref:Neogenin n=1 Tax=Holothuria leucospilota TaxID=206669 RepID=A0A9Q1BNC3_HOLLE|nr:Neogenin [Holothuria leucospilota]